MRKSPRSHRVKGHTRKHGRVGVDPYDRGRGGLKSRTSASSASRAQARSLLLKAKDKDAAKAPGRGELETLTILSKAVKGERIDKALDVVDAKTKVR